MNCCPQCGEQLRPNQRFCTRCGFELHHEKMQQPGVAAAASGVDIACASSRPVVAVSSRAIPLFVWSLILFLLLNPLGAPLALVAAIYSVYAHAGTGNVRALHTARLLCILSTVITGATVFFLVTGLAARLNM